LDPGDYPTGIAISTQQLDALPIERHAVHGAWNSTPHPASLRLDQAVKVGEAGGPTQRRQGCWRDWPTRG
jgi:hypothetical protein